MAGPSGAAENLAKMQEKAKKRLIQRKKAFEAHQAAKKRREKQRLSDIAKIKKERKRLFEKQESARRNFVRKTEVFPQKAYRRFIQRREERWAMEEIHRRNYQYLSHEMKRVFKNKKYNINGRREFDLD